MNNNLFLKRIGAYLIDILIIGILSGMVSSLTFINPNRAQYEQVISDTQKVTSDYLELFSKNNNEESSDNIIENNENDKSKKLEEIQTNLKRLQYKNVKYGYIYIIADIVIIFLYFGIFAYAFKGQTIGKKILKLKIVSNSDKKLNAGNYFIRTFALNGIIGKLATLIGVLFNEDIFAKFNSIGSSIDLLLKVIIFIMIAFTIDKRGLHDIIARTKVIDLKNNNEKGGEMIENS